MIPTITATTTATPTTLVRHVLLALHGLRPSVRRLEREHRLLFGAGNTGWKAIG